MNIDLDQFQDFLRTAFENGHVKVVALVALVVF
jgi:hypothetical protein